MPPKPVNHDDDDNDDEDDGKLPGSSSSASGPSAAAPAAAHGASLDDDNDVLSIPGTPARSPSPNGSGEWRRSSGGPGYWVPTMAPDYGYFVPGAPANNAATPPSPERDIVKIDTFEITISVASPQDKSLQPFKLYITDYAHHGTLVDNGYQLARNAAWISSIALTMAVDMSEFFAGFGSTDYVVFGRPFQATNHEEAIAILQALLTGGHLQVYYRPVSQSASQASATSSGATSSGATSSGTSTSSTSASSSGATSSSTAPGRGRIGRTKAEKDLQKNPALPKPPDGKGKP